MQSGQYELLPVDQVELDTRNPRIRRFLEIYDENTKRTEEQIAFALNAAIDSGDEGLKDATTPTKLRESIVANGGIRQPIIVNRRKDGSIVCVEGNTRLWIYLSLNRNDAPGDWERIPSLLHSDLANEDIDAIRLQAHLVGPRPWDAYSKAKYLWELQNLELMPVNRIIALCGGGKRDVDRAIQAYTDMEAHYRPICDENVFDTERYSGFVEYQNPKVQQAVFGNNFSGTDFAHWIKDKKIKNLAEVRSLPAILGNPAARAVFLKDGVKKALDLIDRPNMDTNLKSASINQLARALATKARTLQMEELQNIQNEADGRTLTHVEDAAAALEFLVKLIRQDL